jgi:hypothetical protein
VTDRATNTRVKANEAVGKGPFISFRDYLPLARIYGRVLLAWPSRINRVLFIFPGHAGCTLNLARLNTAGRRCVALRCAAMLWDFSDAR